MKIAGINMTYEGLIPRIQKSMLAKDKEAMQPHVRAFVERAVTFTACPECGGTRLSDAARSSRIGDINIAEACAMQVSDLAGWVDGLDEPSVAPLLAALRQTLDSFVEIGLGYLSLDRPSGTLSGGEAQRTKMIRQLGSSLTDVTYVFDEPSIGLHARGPPAVPPQRPAAAGCGDKGNTVLVVEHEPEAIRDRRSRRGSWARGRGTRLAGAIDVRGHRRGTAGQWHHHRTAPGRPRFPEAVGADTIGNAGGARRQHPQSAGRRRRHTARHAGRGDRRSRVGKELT